MNSRSDSEDSLDPSNSSFSSALHSEDSSMSLNSAKIELETSSIKKSICYFPMFEKKIKTLASLVPDEIIYWEGSKSSGKQQTYTGVLFFADVSGFTDLCERYTKSGKGGASRITKVLNEYIGVMVQEIMSHNGDVLKFSGDAFLAIWKIKDYTSSMADVVHAAIDCALGIQRSHGQYETDVGIILKVKIAIAAGQIIILVIGDSNFMELGNAMFDVKEVGNICSAGDIIISPAVKMFLSSDQYVLQTISGTPFNRILGIGSDWSPSHLSDKNDIFDTLPEKSAHDDDSDISIVDEDVVAYVLRPSLDYAVSNNLEQYLRKFIIPPVLRAVQLGEPLENLTEMRQVVIVFINVLTRVFSVKQLEFLVEDAYNKVCDAVNSTGGCLNKVSMFDKDLMFLAIYGLRGFKHKLQAQQALYCAKNIREQLMRINQVVCASIGVSSGATYCGVVGHPMRREYTVIGRTVNKAARFMIAYPDMVTCDRQTFIESQLQSRYFTLQPTRVLKGFSNVGPVYKFDDDYSEEHIMEKEMLKTNTFPILDRNKELAIFFGLLHQKTPNHSAISLLDRQFCYRDLYDDYGLDQDINYNVMIVQGPPRWGKSRVLNEISYYVKNEIPHYKCTLNKNSRNYKIFRCIFCEGCKITNVKDIHTRTKYVWRTLAPFKVPQFLCALNDMLYVAFQVTSQYERLSEEELVFVKQKMVKYLGRRIFKTVSLVTIDNIEFMDDESWFLYQEIVKSGTIFTAATMCLNASLPENSKYIVELPETLFLSLDPISECFHGALICQILNVRGVALELEKYIQHHSMGNPGWIDSFLLTLRHSAILKKIDMERSHAYKQGYVLPELQYIRRADVRTHQGSKSYFIFEDQALFSGYTDLTTGQAEDWFIYSQTVPEIEENLSSELTSICTLSKNINLEQLDTEDQVDVLMLRTYDYLNVHEQHVLKCSSIIGDEFTRRQLEYVIQSNDIKIAVAIQKLFEIKVFGCLRAVYNDGEINIKHWTEDPNSIQEIKCYCKGFPEEDLVYFHNLPKYANCNYICFREPAFRQMCSNLLTETQANLYHIRSIWYLENHTRRCRNCNLEYFTYLNGQKNDDGMNIYTIEVFPGKTSSTDLANVNDRLATVKLDTEWSFIFKELTRMQANRQLQPRTFLDTNLKECRCTSIMKTMYSEILEHYQEIGRHESLMNSMLEYAILCITNNNYGVAITLIANATLLLDEKLKYLYPEPEWQVPLTRGRILTIRGNLQMRRQAYKVSEKSLMQALKNYNLTFPTSKTALKALIKYHEFKQKVLFLYYPQRYIGSKDDDVRLLAEQTSETLSTMYELFIIQKFYDKAYLASLWALTEAVRSNTNFKVLCTAFRNASIMDCTYSRPSIIKRIEEMAIETCYKKKTRLDISEFNAVIDMYVAIYRRKTLCENMANSLWLGTVITQINSPKYGGFYNVKAPFLFLKCVCYTYHWSKAIKFVRKTYETLNTTSVKGITPNPMAISLICVQFMNHTTFNIVSLDECLKCFLVRIEPFANKKISQMEMKFYISVWIWYLRKEEWQSSVNIYNHVADTTQWPDMDDPELAYTNCSLLEGLLLLLVRKINLNDLVRSFQIRKFILFLFKRVKKFVQVLKCLKSRYYLYWSYYNMIHRKTLIANKILDKAEVYAEKCSNPYERDWIRHSRRAWQNWPTSSINDKWIASAKRQTILTEDNLSKKDIIFFTLRLPIRMYE